MSRTANTTSIPTEPSLTRYAGRPVRAYLDATRPPFLSVTVVAVLIGLASSLHGGVAVDWWVFLLAAAGALMAHAAGNVLNDYYDDCNGSDPANTQRLFPFTGGSRFIQNGVLTRRQTAIWGGLLMLGTVLVGLVLLARGGQALLWLGLLGVVLAWAYSGPPLALNSHGLGEIVVAVGFGLLIPLGVDLVLRESLDGLPLVAGASYALLVSAILFLNQFPDLEADRLAGKRHWVVRLGARRARWIYALLVLTAYGWLALAVGAGLMPAWALVALVPAPASLAAALILLRAAETPAELVPAIRLTLLAAMTHGALVSLALWLAG